MIRQFIIFSCFCFSMLGCQDPINRIEDPSPPNHKLQIDGNVQFYGEVSWLASNNALNTKIWAENVGADTAKIETGTCAFNVVAYAEDNKPVWYNRTANDYVCPDKLIIYEIAPKETKELASQMYISGDDWHWDMPEGDWNFVIEGKTQNGDSISFNAKETTMN